jgi:hypothetical protein
MPENLIHLGPKNDYLSQLRIMTNQKKHFWDKSRISFTYRGRNLTSIPSVAIKSAKIFPDLQSMQKTGKLNKLYEKTYKRLFGHSQWVPLQVGIKGNKPQYIQVNYESLKKHLNLDEEIIEDPKAMNEAIENKAKEVGVQESLASIESLVNSFDIHSISQSWKDLAREDQSWKDRSIDPLVDKGDLLTDVESFLVQFSKEATYLRSISTLSYERQLEHLRRGEQYEKLPLKKEVKELLQKGELYAEKCEYYLINNARLAANMSLLTLRQCNSPLQDIDLRCIERDQKRIKELQQKSYLSDEQKGYLRVLEAVFFWKGNVHKKLEYKPSQDIIEEYLDIMEAMSERWDEMYGGIDSLTQPKLLKDYPVDWNWKRLGYDENFLDLFDKAFSWLMELDSSYKSVNS